MVVKQALEVVNQALNISLAAGAFKNTKDVAVISHSLEVIANFIAANENNSKQCQDEEKPIKMKNK